MLLELFLFGGIEASSLGWGGESSKMKDLIAFDRVADRLDVKDCFCAVGGRGHGAGVGGLTTTLDVEDGGICDDSVVRFRRILYESLTRRSEG